ncbi:MAG: MoxR family ATPase [Candidatus Latescibacterota bacterium]
MKTRYLQALGVYGYEAVEPIVLAALVTEDPLLLIGKAGTGKTYLLNSLSEALGLEHRHYNASLINFDDLVGFPYPNNDCSEIRYLETPATVWQAESVLIDEISRCKPEQQNRLFSLVHERRIQGLAMPALRYRWAAMNPCSSIDQGDTDFYEGSVALDQALADRFAFIIEVPDWADLSDQDQYNISDPRGEGVLSDDGGALKKQVEQARHTFDQLLSKLPPALHEYAVTVVSLLSTSGIRLSPRRARQLTRNLLAITALNEGQLNEEAFHLTLRSSIPHLAWGQPPDEAFIHSAHRAAWDAVFSQGREKWLNTFLLEPSLPKRIKTLLHEVPDPDTGTLAVTRTLATEPPERQALFAFALYPMTLECPDGPVGREGINELGKVCSNIVDIDEEISWHERYASSGTRHPQHALLSNTLIQLKGKRRERATQLFHYFLVNNITIEKPDAFEKEFNQCITAIRSWLRNQPAH